MGFSGSNGSQIFVGFVARDVEGRPAPVIIEVEITNGSEWVGLNEDEDVALDDVSFLEPERTRYWRTMGDGSVL